MSPARATALLGLALVLAAILFALAPLYVPGLALIAIGAGAPAWVGRAAGEASLECSPAPASVTEGSTVTVHVHANLGRFPGPGGELRGPGARHRLRIGRRGSVELACEVLLSRRGRHRLEPPLLTIADPLGIARVRLAGRSQPVLVLPRIEPLREASAKGLAEAGGRGSVGDAPESDVDGLRPYRPGAPASRIHWPTVARVGRLVERRLQGELDTTPIVVLDSHRPDDEQALDLAVRAAASICVALARAGGCRLLLPGDRHPGELDRGLRAWPAMHAALATLGESAGPCRVPRRPGARLILVHARAERLAARGLALPAGSIEVAPGSGSGDPALFTVAGCSGRLVGARSRGAGRSRAA